MFHNGIHLLQCYFLAMRTFSSLLSSSSLSLCVHRLQEIRSTADLTGKRSASKVEEEFT
jgi:hypothetical protein